MIWLMIKLLQLLAICLTVGGAIVCLDALLSSDYFNIIPGLILIVLGKFGCPIIEKCCE